MFELSEILPVSYQISTVVFEELPKYIKLYNSLCRSCSPGYQKVRG